MGKKFGQICTMLGVLMLISGLYLHLFNLAENRAARTATEEILPEILTQMEIAPSISQDGAAQMQYLEFEGNAYIGYLSIPALELELPVMAQWDYEKLKRAPCRYAGNLWEGNLSIMAHNYGYHFGLLPMLSTGDGVYFTDMNGLTTHFQVVDMDIIDSTEVEEITENEYNLTLFTCTYGGKKRYAVFCNQVLRK